VLPPIEGTLGNAISNLKLTELDFLGTHMRPNTAALVMRQMNAH
jgi:hypothetical protein